NVPDPAELVKHAAKLGLEHDDDRDDDEGGGVLEQPRKYDEVEERGDDTDDRQQDEADHDLRPLSPTKQPQHQIENYRDHGDVEDLCNAEVADDVAQLQEKLLNRTHASVRNNDAISAT